MVDCGDHCSFYIEDLVSLDTAIARDQSKKTIYYSKFSKDFVMAFDEGKRLLAVCGATPVRDVTILWRVLLCSCYDLFAQGHAAQLQVQVFVFDERFTLLSARGSPIQLRRWYEEIPSLRSLLFIAGTEELCLIECSGRARIFSLVTEQFR